MGWNETVIEQFRTGVEKIADRFDQEALLLLHTTGARSGAERVSPVARFDLDGRLLVVASYAGRDENPAWFHNLLADPNVTVELWRDGRLASFAADAVPLPRPERDAVWGEIVSRMPGFGEYANKTDRVIPVVELKPAEPNPSGV